MKESGLIGRGRSFDGPNFHERSLVRLPVLEAAADGNAEISLSSTTGS